MSILTDVFQEDALLAEAFGVDAPVEYKFYNGTQTIYYNDSLHQYTRFDDVGNEVIVPGVTSVTGCLDKPFLMPWAAKMTTDWLRANFDYDVQYTPESFETLLQAAKRNYKDYTQAAADTGKIAHDWLEGYIKSKIYKTWFGHVMPMDSRAENAIKAALSWFDEHNVVFIASERKIYSKEFDFAGTLDLIAEVNGVLGILDFKTSNSLHRLPYGMQTAAYQLAQKEERGLDIKERWLLRLGKEDAKFEVMHLDSSQYPRDIDCFLSCLDTYRKTRQHEEQCKAERDAAKAEIKAAKELAKIAAKEEKERLKAEKRATKK